LLQPSDPKKSSDEGAAKQPAAKDVAAAPKDAKKKDAKDEELALAPEDRKLKETLEAAVAAVVAAQDASVSESAYLEAQTTALQALRREIKNSTSTMTAIPKPLKFLRPFYADLKACYNDAVRMRPSSAAKPLLADVLSALAMTQAADKAQVREVLAFRLLGSQEPLSEWGHEYIQALTAEIGIEYQLLVDEDLSPEELIALIDAIIEFDFKHASEFQAVDFLIEVSLLPKLQQYVSEDNVLRVGKYLLACAAYIGDVEERDTLVDAAFEAFVAHGRPAYALIAALKRGGEKRDENALRCFAATNGDVAVQRQLGYILGSQKVYIPAVEAEYEAAVEPMGNTQLSAFYLDLAKDLDVLEPKSPADVFKDHLEPGMSRRGANYDSAFDNLASTIANAFINVGFCKDTLMLGADGAATNSDWLFRHKDAGMLTAAASVGVLSLWNVEEGFSTTDKFSFSKTHPTVTSGSHLASGLLSAGVTSDMNASLALLSEQLESDSDDTRTGALLGLGVSYAGSCNEDVLELLVPVIVDGANPIGVVSMAILALGLVFAGSANHDVFGSCMEALVDRDNTPDLEAPVARLSCIGMALLYLGTQNTEMALEITAALQHPLRQYLLSTVDTFAAAGSGSVLQIQKMLGLCATKPDGAADDEDDEEEEEEVAAAGGSKDKAAAVHPNPAVVETKKAAELKKENTLQRPMKQLCRSSSVIGLGAAAMGEDLAAQMALRSLDHLLQCGDVYVRRAVPLALALVSISNPQLPVMDTLSKISHDGDQFVSMNAVLALGLLGAGTNNSRIAAMLRALASFYAREPNHLFTVRVAQGLLHMGKGLVTLSPRSHDGQLTNKPALAALMVLLHLGLDLPENLIKVRHYMFFTLAAAIRPRFLFTVDADGAQTPVQVRVGQAVDAVGQPGNPRTITGFQTHTTPVLLSFGERAELATDDFIAMTDVLEGVVVVKPNPKAVGKEI
jgi:26S proteasome regulatory subunit N1